MTIDRQRDHQPDHLLSRQATATNARRACRFDGLFDPRMGKMLRQPAQVGRFGIAHEGQVVGQHRAKS